MAVVDFAAFVDELATASGQAILPFFRTTLGATLNVDNKSNNGVFDPVTEADRAGETVMRRIIGRTFPEHGIVGEEFGSERADAEFVWVLDPIDGTKSFMCGLPVWGTMIGLLQNNSPVYGLIHQPYTNERFFGDGMSAKQRTAHGERPLRVRECQSLAEATLMTTSPLLMGEADRACFKRVENEVRLSRYGGDCYSYCMLAAGQIDLVIEAGLKAHDIVAAIPILKGAGGIITTWDGGDPANGGNIIAAGDKKIYEAARTLLGG
jgi:myo-inositol-1(or 4)-monophosphatase